MGQRVHAGGGRQFSRHRDRHVGIQNRQVRKKLLFGKRQFDVVVRVGNNGHFGDLRSRSGGCRDNNGGKQGFTAVEKVGAHVVPKMAPLDGQEIGNLGRVDDTPPPDRNEQIATLLPCKGGTFFHRFNRGIGWHLIKGRRNFDWCGFKTTFDLGDKAGLLQDSIGHQNGFALSQRFERFAEIFNDTDPVHQFGRK